MNKTKEQNRAYCRRYALKKRFQIMTEFGGRCQKCGYSDKRALEFHHIGKRDGMTDYLNKDLWNRLVLLCANCHHLEHFSLPQIKPKMPKSRDAVKKHIENIKKGLNF
jgi:5-methylcytosine-specific restriction endonuclease McrA